MLMEKENITPEYVQQVDVEPDFWQFLIGLRADDLISELVQNDIDAGASRTKITFGKNQFICEGDGASIDSDGWKRLSFLKGAGNKAPRKINSIGVKNHGLKACFTIGDDITIKSDGKMTRQTLIKRGTIRSRHQQRISIPWMTVMLQNKDVVLRYHIVSKS